MILTAKFKIGARVTVAPMDEEEVEADMNGVVTKIDTDDYGDGEVAYVVLLDNPLPGHPLGIEPTIDTVEWELTPI